MASRIYAIHFTGAIDAVAADDWNALFGASGYPFIRHQFLAALEHSGCVGTRESGWLVEHALVERDGRLVAAMPLYRKLHSYGEYVFDWQWADAYARYGLRYYPKLLAAIPFTPATGPRFGVAVGEDEGEIVGALLDALRERVNTERLSSLHLLFPEPALRDQLLQNGMSLRCGVQYHWFNRGYGCFDDFLAALSSRKRKGLRREREQVAQAGVTLRWLHGAEIDPAAWRRFHHFYQRTYAKRSGHGGYLNRAFFEQLGAKMGEQVLLCEALRDGEVIAAALYLRDAETLYGRYWGCSEEIPGLHFEACYYQGIDYCIREGLQRFDAGAQGEHKLLRGFEPVLTDSCHWIADVRFREAIDHFLQQERLQVETHLQSARELLPYRR
jgi:predicted N-acyltransferase